jgi:phosphoadenosine phosphosulfate reductase
MRAEDRVAWALDNLPGEHIVSSSFGAQSAVMLHLLTQQKPDIPVVLVDTGYLFPETYRFVDELSECLDLNLRIYRALTSAAWQEARYGERWHQGREALSHYNYDNKVEPMERALRDLRVGTWFAGLRRVQADTRQDKQFVERSGDRFKVHPIIDWSDRDVHRYLTKHDLPYHPLWKEGYVSIGDVHSTTSLADVDSIEETRFGGLLRECGLHEMDFGNPEPRSA